MTEAVTVTLDPSGATFPALPGQRLLEAAREAGVWLPYECGWGSCGTCKATLVSGEVASLFPEAPAISDRDRKRNRVLLCQSSASTDIVLRPLRESDSPEDSRPTALLRGAVTANVEVAPGIHDVRVATDGPVVFRPGQFAIVRGAQGLRRCYSLAGESGAAEARFVLKAYDTGRMSTWMAALAPGDPLDLEAPYGDMWLRRGDRPVLLLAGGTGISAILPLMRQAAAAGRAARAVYGARTALDLALLDELRAAADARNCTAVPVVESGPVPADGLVGRVPDALTGVPLIESDVYLAGPPAMVDAVMAALDAAGAQRDRVFVDRFG